MLASAPALAQSSPVSQQDADEALARHLRTLAENPHSVSALTGAGESALAMGDAQAALGWFAKAEELAPRDGRIKARIGSTLVMMEQAKTALDYFDQATDLGVPDIDIAADRGLAYDLRGNPRRAQKDYALVLARRDDPDVRRRMALSLAISGDRDAALAMIHDQLQNQDRSAWRVRAFILALTGDTAGATEAMKAVMPFRVTEMAPFFAQLPSLTPAQKAAAVNFGHFPGKNPLQGFDRRDYTDNDDVTDAGKPDESQPSLRPRNPPPAPVSTASRRRPGAAEAETEVKQTDFADVAALVASLSEKAKASPPPKAAEPKPSAPAKAEAPKKTKASAKAASTKKAEKKAPPKPKYPSRHWVQIAGGANKDDLDRAFRRLKAKAPKLLGSKMPWTTPLHATNRLLVGPFKTEDEAQDFVNDLAKADLDAFSWTSPDGQEIEKLSLK